MAGSITNLKRLFSSDERGNVAVIFALSAIPIFGITGLAIDYGRAVSARNQIQAATDTAALAAAAAKFKTTAERETIARQTFAANVANNSRLASVIPTFTQDLGLTTVTAQAQIPTSFMGILGFQALTAEGVSKVSTAGKKLELALMFDVTGSMTGTTSGGNTKIFDAKAAANDLLDVVMPSGIQHNTRMSLIPFSQRVKLDATTIAAVTGMPDTRQTPVTTTTTRDTYTLSTTSFNWRSLSQCVKRMRDDYFIPRGENYSLANDHADELCRTFETRTNNGKLQYKTPAVIAGTETVTTTTYITEYIKPCVVERNTSNYARKTGESSPLLNDWVATYSTTMTANVACPPNGSNGVGSLIPLTADRDRLQQAIADLQTGGSTAGHIGTAWAWYTISPEWRSVWESESDPVDYTDDTTIKAAILMTDGEYNSCNGSSTYCADSAVQALAICTKMKAQGIQVWTIGFGMSTNTDDPARQTLMQCADPGRYFFPYNGAELRNAFQAIGQALSEATTQARLVQ